MDYIFTGLTSLGLGSILDNHQFLCLKISLEYFTDLYCCVMETVGANCSETPSCGDLWDSVLDTIIIYLWKPWYVLTGCVYKHGELLTKKVAMWRMLGQTQICFEVLTKIPHAWQSWGKPSNELSCMATLGKTRSPILGFTLSITYW